MTRARGSAVAASLIAATLLGGCVFTGAEHSQRALIGNARVPSQGPVRVVLRGETVTERYDEIAIVQAKSSWDDDGRAAILEALKREARAVGANGVIEVRIDDTYAKADDPEQGWFLASGVAVRFEPGEGRTGGGPNPPNR
jgi:uncharacterized protein YbjQ (UPF0145 family)